MLEAGEVSRRKWVYGEIVSRVIGYTFSRDDEGKQRRWASIADAANELDAEGWEFVGSGIFRRPITAQ